MFFFSHLDFLGRTIFFSALVQKGQIDLPHFLFPLHFLFFFFLSHQSTLGRCPTRVWKQRNIIHTEVHTSETMGGGGVAFTWAQTLRLMITITLCITQAAGSLTEDLVKDIMAFPGFSDLPLCGSCRVAHISGYCAGKDHIVSLTGCKTASCLCDPSREQIITSFILKEAGYACGTKDTATPGRAVDVYRAFCASQPPVATPVSLYFFFFYYIGGEGKLTDF